jgi:hypothetical protein
METNRIVKLKWEEEVPKRIAEYFNSMGINYRSDVSYRTALIDFMNMNLKLVNAVPRKVYKSKEFLARKVSFDDICGVNYLTDKIESGFDINYHQSRNLLDPKHNDLLLNNWVIYHFHIGRKQEEDGFYERTQNVVFVIFSDKQAFFVDVLPHGAKGEPYVFARQELLEIIDNNWPEILTVHSHQDAQFLNNEYTNKEINILRKKGYTIATTIVNGKVIANPGIGQTSSGHNSHVIKRAGAVSRILYGTQQFIEENHLEIKTKLSEKAGFDIPELNFSIIRIPEWPFFTFLETNCNMTVD